MEHPPVVTLGRQATAASLHLSPEALAARGVAVHSIPRGGDVTCHFPGQLVVYAILSVDRRPGGLHGLVHALEEAAIRVLAARGVQAGRREGHPGVWVEGRKIASLGLAVRKWVSWHGLALNIGADLSLFETMTPCGLPGVVMTSLARETGSPWTVAEILDPMERELRALL